MTDDDSSSKPGPAPDWRRGLMDASPYLGLGLQLAVAMAFFIGGGYLLDRWLGSLPWLTVAGAALGMIGVFFQIVRVSNELSRRNKPGRKPTSGAETPPR